MKMILSVLTALIPVLAVADFEATDYEMSSVEMNNLDPRCEKLARDLVQDDVIGFTAKGKDSLVAGLKGQISVIYPDAGRQTFCRLIYCHNFNSKTMKPDAEQRCSKLQISELAVGTGLIPGAPDALRIRSTKFDAYLGGTIEVIFGRKQNIWGTDKRIWNAEIYRSRDEKMRAYFGPKSQNFNSLEVEVSIGRTLGKITSGELKSATVMNWGTPLEKIDLKNLPVPKE